MTNDNNEQDWTLEDEELYLYGDGRPTYHYGQDGDPRNGQRVWNSKEEDARHRAEAERLFQASVEAQWMERNL